MDMALSPRLCEWLRQRGHDAVHASQIGMSRAADQALLDHARHDNRIIITADLDYLRLLVMTQSEGPGAILFRGGDYAEDEARERLAAVPAEELTSSLVVIEKTRIRHRRLPIKGP
ncbi:MAG: DUF5615 family PIN-like protein [Chloroflexi bacterium]|nr:DUF5615 family PIN-like protein [Chloroflexota bacterium]